MKAEFQQLGNRYYVTKHNGAEVIYVSKFKSHALKYMKKYNRSHK